MKLGERLLHLLAERVQLLAGEVLADQREELALLLLDVVLDELLQDLHLRVELLVRRLHLEQIRHDALGGEVLLDGLPEPVLERSDVDRRVEDLLLDLAVRGEVVGDPVEELLLLGVLLRGLELLEELLHLLVLLHQQLRRFHAGHSSLPGGRPGREVRRPVLGRQPGHGRRERPPRVTRGRLAARCRDLLQWGPWRVVRSFGCAR